MTDNTSPDPEEKFPPDRVWLPLGVVSLAAVSPELKNVEGAYYIREDTGSSPDPEKVREIRAERSKMYFASGRATGAWKHVDTLLNALDARPSVWNAAIEVARKVGKSIASGEEYNEYHGLIADVIEALEAARTKEQGK